MPKGKPLDEQRKDDLRQKRPGDRHHLVCLTHQRLERYQSNFHQPKHSLNSSTNIKRWEPVLVPAFNIKTMTKRRWGRHGWYHRTIKKKTKLSAGDETHSGVCRQLKELLYASWNSIRTWQWWPVVPGSVECFREACWSCQTPSIMWSLKALMLPVLKADVIMSNREKDK